MTKQRTVLVTGATGGLGRAMSDRLAADGYSVIGLGRSEAADFPGLLVRVDLVDRLATQAALDAIVADHEVDALVNNAGVSRIMALEEFDFDSFRAMLDIHLCAAVQCAKACAVGMTARGHGRIVNIGSVGLKGVPRTSGYSAAKAGLQAMTVSWAMEMADKGVTVNMVAPGAIDGGMFPRNNPPGSPRRERIMSRIPMGRLGTPSEVAGAVAFFLSDDATYVTGQTLYVCGGWSIGA